MKHVLFIDVRNATRSQIAEAWFNHLANGCTEARSCGTMPADRVGGRAIEVMKEVGMELNIYSVSAAAIEQVEIAPGESKAIRIRILMNNSAGVFQVDELMKDKLRGSGLENHVEVEARTEGGAEKNLVPWLKV